MGKRAYSLCLGLAILFALLSLVVLRFDRGDVYRTIHHVIHLPLSSPFLALCSFLPILLGVGNLPFLIILLAIGRRNVAPFAWPATRRFLWIILVINIIPFLIPLEIVSPGTRWVVARAHADMNSIKIAIASYYLDLPGKLSGSSRAGMALSPLPPLTTPVAYLSQPLTDPFATDSEPHASFRYLSNSHAFVIQSPGPDLIIDLHDADFVSTSSMMSKAYDPTNGILSGGDMFLYSTWAGDEQVESGRYIFQ